MIHESLRTQGKDAAHGISCAMQFHHIFGDEIMSHVLAKSIAAFLAIGVIGMNCNTSYASESNLDCKLHFSLNSWSIIYKQAKGKGLVECADGTSMHVYISAKGGGLTVGKSHIDNGTGTFSDIHSIRDVLGSYAQGEAHAGVVKSGDAQVLTKGTVSLALAGDGQGVDIGVDFGDFTLTRARQ
jgi:hypothetical protein